MAYSMTGFGRGEKVFDTRKYSVELKSVNSRFCDINIRLPRFFNFAEVDVRRIITERLVRGKIDCYINYDDTDGAGQTVTVNAGLAKAYSDAAKVLAEVSGRDDNFNATNLAGFQDVLSIEQRTIDETRALEELTETLNAAIDGMLAMRKREGDALCENILSKVDNIKAVVLKHKCHKILTDIVNITVNRCDNDRRKFLSVIVSALKQRLEICNR